MNPLSGVVHIPDGCTHLLRTFVRVELVGVCIVTGSAFLALDLPEDCEELGDIDI